MGQHQPFSLPSSGALVSGFLVALQAPTNAMLPRRRDHRSMRPDLLRGRTAACCSWRSRSRPAEPPAKRSSARPWLGGLYGAVFVSMPPSPRRAWA
jgi:uncharacterized membrane protein YdcZ (DUF606 family)